MQIFIDEALSPAELETMCADHDTAEEMVEQLDVSNTHTHTHMSLPTHVSHISHTAYIEDNVEEMVEQLDVSDVTHRHTFAEKHIMLRTTHVSHTLASRVQRGK